MLRGEGELGRFMEQSAAPGDARPPAGLLDLIEGGAGSEEFDASVRVGPYRILGVLGEGGMGKVYRAEQVEPIRRAVALKVVHQRLGPSWRRASG